MHLSAKEIQQVICRKLQIIFTPQVFGVHIGCDLKEFHW